MSSLILVALSALAAPLTPEQAGLDLDVMLERLDAMYIHPEHIQSAAFRERAAEVRAGLAGVDDTRGLWTLAAPLIASLDDGHTYLLAPVYIEGADRVLPLNVTLRGGVLSVVREDGQPVTPRRVTSIDGEPVDPLIAHWLTHFSGEVSWFRESWITDDFERLWPWWTGRDQISLVFDDGTERVYVASAPASAPVAPDPGRGWAWRREGAAMVLRMEHFTMERRAWQRDLRAMFKTMKKDQVDALILDVRGNGGGNSMRIAGLVPFLVAPWRIYSGERVRQSQPDGSWSEPISRDMPMFRYRLSPRFDGPVAVLTDAATFSTAADLAVVLSDLERAVVVGESPGGMPTCTGNLTPVALPSGLMLYVATAEFLRANPARGTGPLVVDVEAPPERALEAALDYLRTR